MDWAKDGEWIDQTKRIRSILQSIVGMIMTHFKIIEYTNGRVTNPFTQSSQMMNKNSFMQSPQLNNESYAKFNVL